MADPAQPHSIVVILVIAVLSLLWQILRALRRKGQGRPAHDPVFWIGATAWVVLGLLLRTYPGFFPLGDVGRWLLPTLGLLTAGGLGWALPEPPRFQRVADELPLDEEEAPVVDTAEEEENGNGLGAEELQLVRRLVGLLSRRVADLMVPVTAVVHVDTHTPAAHVLELLASDGEIRIPVLDRAGTRAVGIIDGRDLLPSLYAAPAGEGTPAPRAGELCRRIATVDARKQVKKALEALRTEGNGVAAVVDSHGRLVGFLGWPMIFRVLVGRPPEGGQL